MTLCKASVLFISLLSISSGACGELGEGAQPDGSEVGSSSSALYAIGDGVDLDAGCKRERGPSARIVLQDRNAFGWRCEHNGSRYGVDVSQYCRWQYPSISNQCARTQNPRDPYSWLCVAPC